MSLRTILICLVAAFATTTLTAQELDLGVRSYGLRGGINLNPDQFNFGGHVDLGRLGSRVRLQPSAEVGLGNGVVLASANFDLHYLMFAGSWRPYVGGGAGLNAVDVYRGFGSSDGLQLEPVANAVGGVEWGGSSSRRYLLEGRFGFGKTPDFKVVAGINF